MIAVVSKDGFLTKGKDPNPSSWTSPEDMQFYRAMLQKFNLYLLGATTYTLAKNSLPKHAHKIVMSHKFDNDRADQKIDYTHNSFSDIINKYGSEYSSMLVLGGGSIYHQMIKEKLIDEAYISVEPVDNYNGVKLVENDRFFEDSGFVLTEEKPLNNSGTILKHYHLKN